MLSDAPKNTPLSFCYFQSNHRRCSVNKSVLKNFANFTGNQLCWSLFLIKLKAFRTFLLNHPSVLLHRIFFFCSVPDSYRVKYPNTLMYLNISYYFQQLLSNNTCLTKTVEPISEVM